jgi:hypothetical protein
MPPERRGRTSAMLSQEARTGPILCTGPPMRTNIKRPDTGSSEGETREAIGPTDKVRSLQGKLYAAAKANPTRRRRNKPGLGRIWDYTDEYLHKELGLASIVDQGSVRYPDRERLHERGR